MKLKPLSLANENDWSGQIQIVCKSTGKREKWNNAVRFGWVADLEGEPFSAYYSPQGIAILQSNASK